MSKKVFIGDEQVAMMSDVENVLADKQDKLVTGVNIKSINGIDLLGPGEAQITKVMLADNLYSSDSQSDVSEFIARTSGGNISIDTGSATLVRLRGVSTTPTHTPETLNYVYNCPNKPTVTFDEATWLITGSNDIDYTKVYTYDGDNQWSYSSTAGGSGYDYTDNMANYGIIVNGEPLIGDTITIDYYTDGNYAILSFNTSFVQASYSFDRDTWRSYVNTNGIYTFTYDGVDWKLGGGLQAFTIGQTLSNGDKIHFNENVNVDNILSQLTFTEGVSNLMIATSGVTDFYIIHVSDLNELGVGNGYMIFVKTGTSSEEYPVYCSIAIPEYGIQQGWQNLDANNDATLSSTFIVKSFGDNSEIWNGVLVGTGSAASSVDLADYGITIDGTPNSGDNIVITYSKVDFGSISNCTPTQFKSIGFNLYNHTTGLARVVGSESGQWYNVKGTFTSLEFSTEPDGTFTPISLSTYTVGSYSTDNGFAIYQNGYVKVIGGDDTTTMINLIWSGYMIGADYQSYTESVIDIPTSGINLNTMDPTTLPTELRSVGDYRDEISFDLSTWTVNIGRMAYTAANLEQLISDNPLWVEGREYNWDNDYIYYKLDTPVVYSISSSLTGIYDVDDFGIEELIGTTVPGLVSILYGQNLKDKLRRDVLTIGPQTLTQEQKQQVWQNLGIEPIGDNTF